MTEIWAHRGSAEHERENTVAAFRAAGALGADGVELDVRLSADGVPIVHHDAALASGTPVRLIPAADLPDWLPSLDQALEACAGMTVNVEVKVEERAGAGTDLSVARVAARVCTDWMTSRAGASEGAGAGKESGVSRLVVSSFSRRALDEVRAEAPGLELAWLVSPPAHPGRARELLEAAAEAGYEGLHPYESMIDEALAEAARAGGLALRAWTVDDGRRVAELADLGIDAVITNDVVTARRALSR